MIRKDVLIDLIANYAITFDDTQYNDKLFRAETKCYGFGDNRTVLYVRPEILSSLSEEELISLATQLKDKEDKL